MRRATACFSMYSLMSMRTMECSSSKRNSASARAVSVLPTPVGPRKMNEPMGRLGSLSPARERRMAFATTVKRGILADNALAQAVFHLDELLDLALQHARDGNARPLADDLGDVFLVDLFFQHARLRRHLPSCAAFSFLSSASSLGSSPYWICAARSSWPLRVCSSISKRSASIFFFKSLMRVLASRSLVTRAL